jgi:Ca2+-transporting ATPase
MMAERNLTAGLHAAIDAASGPEQSEFSKERGFAGLSQAEAERRLLTLGANEMPRAEARTLLAILKGVLSEPMFLLLLTAACVYLAFSNLTEGLVMLVFAGVSVGLVVSQEYRGEKSLEALLAFTAPTSRVLRDGVERKLPAREIVPGDGLLVHEGERIAADGTLREGQSVRVDESLLTGESIPVRKIAQAHGAIGGKAVPGGDDLPFVFAGTLMVGGGGLVEVAATGARTRAGQIGQSIAAIASGKTPLETSIAGIVKTFGILALLASIGLVALFGWRTGNWFEGILSGLALAMAMVPEEFPMVLAIFTVLGARRLTRINVLSRRAAAVETLGAVSVLCVDKTGTLTENRIVLDTLVSGLKTVSGLGVARQALDPSLAAVLAVAARACEPLSADPIDRAILAAGKLAGGDAAGVAAVTLIRFYPLTPERLAAVAITDGAGGGRRAAAKGAPEAIADLCRLQPEDRRLFLGKAAELATDGLRVLAVAEGDISQDAPPADPADAAWRFLGFAAFADPVRPTVPAAVAEARRAGVAVVMITGDHPATALAIAGKAGIATDGGCLTGVEIENLDPEALARAVRQTRVFARIMPEQKLRIVQAFIEDGAVVAMTGDGVNDGPALKAAHVGIAMGGRGTDVAREAADIVLLSDDFSHIVAGIRLGRRIFDNLRKVLLYVTAAHATIVGMAIAPLVLGLPPILFPAHVVVTELIIDTTCSLAFERTPGEKDLMERGPRAIGEPIIGWPLVLLGLLQGGLVFAAAFAVYVAAIPQGLSTEAARGAGFIAMIAGNLMLVRVNMARGWTLPRLGEASQQITWLILLVACLFVIAIFAVPVLTEIFHVQLPPLAWVAGSVAAGLAAALCFDLIKTLPLVRRSLWRGNGHAAPLAAR